MIGRRSLARSCHLAEMNKSVHENVLVRFLERSKHFGGMRSGLVKSIMVALQLCSLAFGRLSQFLAVFVYLATVFSGWTFAGWFGGILAAACPGASSLAFIWYEWAWMHAWLTWYNAAVLGIFGCAVLGVLCAGAAAAIGDTDPGEASSEPGNALHFPL